MENTELFEKHYYSIKANLNTWQANGDKAAKASVEITLGYMVRKEI